MNTNNAKHQKNTKKQRFPLRYLPKKLTKKDKKKQLKMLIK